MEDDDQILTNGSCASQGTSTSSKFWVARMLRLMVGLIIAVLAIANWCLEGDGYQASSFPYRVEHAPVVVEHRFLASVPTPGGLANSTCARVCGTISVPYPFGLSTGCARNPYFQLECRHISGSGIEEFQPGSWPFLTHVNGSFMAGLPNTTNPMAPTEHLVNSFQIVEINGTAGTLMINTTAIKVTSCLGVDPLTFGNASIRLPPSGPYRSSTSNLFFVAGCRAQSQYSIYAPVLDFGNANTTLPGDTCGATSCTNQPGNFPFCNFWGCCTLSMPPTKNIFLTGGGDCGYGTVLYPPSYASSNPNQLGSGTYGLELIWGLEVNGTQYPNCLTIAKTLADYACSPQATCQYRYLDYSYAGGLDKVSAGYFCQCTLQGFEGDGYLDGTGCQDVDECASSGPNMHQCDTANRAVCTNLIGSYNCTCPGDMWGNGFRIGFRNGSSCTYWPNSSNNDALIIGISSGGGLLLLLLCIAMPMLWKLRKQVISFQKIEQALADQKVQPPFYSYYDLKVATRDFHSDNKLGKGAFGVVYKGILLDGTILAVKKLFNSRSNQVLGEFLNEVVLITGLKHRNLIQLKGCCIKDNQRILVYEYATNGNLAEALWGGNIILNWQRRFDICVGVARGLSYLHEELQPRIIHRDIKPANILLDKNFNPRIADFGLAKSFLDEESHVQYTHVAGTMGYFAPEYATEGQLTEKADVYSFGILVLEIVSGRQWIDKRTTEEEMFLRNWALQLQKRKRLMDLLQPELKKNCIEVEVMRVINIALICVQMDPTRRATMSQVVTMLVGSMDDMVTSFSNMAKHNQFDFNLLANASKCYGSDTLPLATSQNLGGIMEMKSDEYPLLDTNIDSRFRVGNTNSNATIELSNMVAR